MRAWLAAAVALGSCASPDTPLGSGGWDPRNLEVLRAFIRDHGRGGRFHDEARPPFAVFDWDYTSAFLDCEEALFRYQLWNLEFKLTPDEFRALLKDEIGGVTSVSAGSRTLALREFHAGLVDHYRFLWGRPPDDVRSTPQFGDFIAKMGFLYEAYCDTPGIGPAHAYPWILYLLGNRTVDEVQALALRAIEQELTAPLESATWASADGSIRYAFRRGLRIHPEMRDLMASFRRAGIDVYVVTASLREVVQVFAGKRFGYDVPEDHVIGMELEERDGRLLPSYRPGWIQTWRAGKAEAIRRRLQGDPIFGSGDSDGDYEMLTEFPGMKLSLVMNRLKGGDIGRLCRKAAEEREGASPRHLLQGRDENAGSFIPSAATIPPGRAQPRLLQ
jgi:phosphoserine phosphatase